MSDFNYLAPALLFAAQGRSGLRYRRFLNAADAQRQHGHHADRHNGHATEDACVYRPFLHSTSPPFVSRQGEKCSGKKFQLFLLIESGALDVEELEAGYT